MKKALILTAVFILAAVFFTCCKSNRVKIMPDPLPPENGINVETPTKEAPKNKAAENTDTQGRQGDTERAAEEKKRDIAAVPKIEVRDGYLRNRDERWAAAYDNGEVLDALNKMGVSVATISGIEVAGKDGNDCAAVISVGGRNLNAYDFKEALGLKSTMITEISRGEGEFTFIGYGEN